VSKCAGSGNLAATRAIECVKLRNSGGLLELPIPKRPRWPRAKLTPGQGPAEVGLTRRARVKGQQKCAGPGPARPLDSVERVDDFRSSCVARATGSSFSCLVPHRMSHRMSCSGPVNCRPSSARTAKSFGVRSTTSELSSALVPWLDLRESASGLPIDFPGL